MPVIELDGETVAYTVRHSRRAKRVFVKVSLESGLEVVYPAGRQTPTPEDLLRAKSDWVIVSLRRIRQASANHFRRKYEDGEIFLVRGVSFRLKLRCDDAGRKATTELRGDALELTLPPGACYDDLEWRRDAILRFYRQLAQDYLPTRVAELASEYGFSYNRLRIKHQKTRWGSCSAKGNINLNLRLIMAPCEAIDYVIIHELCHLRELNHSKQFWTQVESCCPEYRNWIAWFKQHRAQLIL